MAVGQGDGISWSIAFGLDLDFGDWSTTYYHLIFIRVE
jgi:hypothetical protein